MYRRESDCYNSNVSEENQVWFLAPMLDDSLLTVKVPGYSVSSWISGTSALTMVPVHILRQTQFV